MALNICKVVQSVTGMMPCSDCGEVSEFVMAQLSFNQAKG